MTITLPKIRLRLSKSASKTKHTLAEMSVAYDCIASQSGLEIYSVEQDCKSVYQKETKTYIIECKGHSYDSTVYGDYEKAWEIWYNSGDLPFTDKAFDLKSAIIDFNIGMYTAIKDFNFEDNCQLHYDKFWMPYIVLNIDELINFLKKLKIVKSIEINRSYEVLGGNVKRLLPKDLYFKSAGGAETTIEINLDRENKSNSLKVLPNDSIEGRPLINLKKQKRIFIKILKILKILK